MADRDAEDNPQESSFREPLNLLKDFRKNIDNIYSADSNTIDDKGQPLWSYAYVTERQVVLDCTQLLLGLETPTFERVLDRSNN